MLNNYKHLYFNNCQFYTMLKVFFSLKLNPLILDIFDTRFLISNLSTVLTTFHCALCAIQLIPWPFDSPSNSWRLPQLLFYTHTNKTGIHICINEYSLLSPLGVAQICVCLVLAAGIRNPTREPILEEEWQVSAAIIILVLSFT